MPDVNANHQEKVKIKVRLSTKLIISFVLLECLLMVAIVLVVERQMRQSVMDEFLKRAMSLSRNLSANNTNFIATYNYIKIEQNIKQVIKKNDLLYTLVSFFDGEVAAYSGKEKMKEMICSGDLQKRALNAGAELIQYGVFENQKFCEIAIPVFIKGEKWGTVRTGFSLENIRIGIRQTRKLLVLLGIIALLSGCVAFLFLAQRITRPIEKLVRSTEFISRGEYDNPIEIRTQDEIGYLGNRFAVMQETLKQHIQLLTNSNQRLENEIEVRKKREKELIEAKKEAETANIAKSNFLTNISHELRTPLNGVLGMTELLQDTTEVSERQQRYLNSVHQAGKTLFHIINEILDFSKIEAGSLGLANVKFDLIETVEKTVVSFAEKAEKKGLELICLIHHDVSVLVLGDPDRLHQILTNLIDNAIKFTEQGEVMVRVQVSKQDKKNDMLKFEVIDTGIGIKPDIMTTIFDPFSQADGSLTREYGGTGLGLTMAKELVQLMGSSIDVESRPGHGSTFRFAVQFEKLGDPVRDNTTAAARNNMRLTGIKALVADDNRVGRSALTYYLESWGMRCREAESASQLFDMLRNDSDNDPTQIVLMDMALLDGDIRKAAREIQSDPARADVRLVLLAPGSLGDEEKNALLQDFCDILTKPIRRTHLFDSLINFLKAPKKSKPSTDSRCCPVDSTAMSSNRRVLVVEDNPLNQVMAEEMLKRLGYTVDVVLNGQEAVEAFTRKHYDIITMDCQMPVMDGYEATRIIRETEKSRHLQTAQTPIIAVTAHAMEGDHEKCLAAGMNDYLSKPYTIDQLQSVIQRWLHQKKSKEAQTTEYHPTETVPSTALKDKDISKSIDRNRLEALRNLAATSGKNVLAKVIEVYFQDFPKQLVVLQSAVSQGDAATIQSHAHKLKSSSSNLGALTLSELCSKLEKAAREKSIEKSPALLAGIEDEYQKVHSALSEELKKT